MIKHYICRVMYLLWYTVLVHAGWKNLSLGMMFQGTHDAERIMSGSSIQPFNGGGGSGNLYSNIDDRWTEDNPNQNAFTRVCPMELKLPVTLTISSRVHGGFVILVSCA